MSEVALSMTSMTVAIVTTEAAVVMLVDVLVQVWLTVSVILRVSDRLAIQQLQQLEPAMPPLTEKRRKLGGGGQASGKGGPGKKT